MDNTVNFGSSVPDVFSSISGANFTFPHLVQLGIRVLFVGITLGSFIFLLMGAFQWIMAGGDKEGIEKAKKRITNSLIGLAIGFSVYAISVLLSTIFGVEILNNIAVPTL